MTKPRYFFSRHGSVYVTGTREHMVVTLETWGKSSILAGRISRVTSSNGKPRWMAHPACDCEPMSFRTLAAAATTLANAAVNVASDPHAHNHTA